MYSDKNSTFDNEILDGTLDDYLRKKIENSPYYDKIRNIIKKIIQSGYKPIFDVDWEIARSSSSSEETIKDCNTKTYFHQDYIFYLDSDGKFREKIVTNGDYESLIFSNNSNKIEYKPTNVEYNDCSIGIVALETDFYTNNNKTYRYKKKGNDVFTTFSSIYHDFNRDISDYRTRSKYIGESLFIRLCNLYKKVLDTPKRLEDIKQRENEKRQEENERKKREEEIKREEQKKEEQKRKREAEERNRNEEARKKELEKIEKRHNKESFILLSLECFIYFILLNHIGNFSHKLLQNSMGSITIFFILAMGLLCIYIFKLRRIWLIVLIVFFNICFLIGTMMGKADIDTILVLISGFAQFVYLIKILYLE